MNNFKQSDIQVCLIPFDVVCVLEDTLETVGVDSVVVETVGDVGVVGDVNVDMVTGVVSTVDSVLPVHKEVVCPLEAKGNITLLYIYNHNLT